MSPSMTGKTAETAVPDEDSASYWAFFTGPVGFLTPILGYAYVLKTGADAGLWLGVVISSALIALILGVTAVVVGTKEYRCRHGQKRAVAGLVFGCLAIVLAFMTGFILHEGFVFID